jgi:CRP-like cAMP-binding protein
MTDENFTRGGFLAKFSPAIRARLLSLGESCKYPAEQTIYHKGDPSRYLYIVESGQVAIEISLPMRDRKTLMTIGPGGAFGWPALIESRTATASARAIEQVDLLRIEGKLLRDLCSQDPRLGLELYRVLTESLSTHLATPHTEAFPAPGSGVDTP